MGPKLVQSVGPMFPLFLCAYTLWFMESIRLVGDSTLNFFENDAFHNVCEYPIPLLISHSSMKHGSGYAHCRWNDDVSKLNKQLASFLFAKL